MTGYRMSEDPEGLARAAASSAVLTTDPFAQTAAPDYWHWSEDAHRRVVDTIMTTGEPDVTAATQRLLRSPDDGHAHLDLEKLLLAAFGSDRAPWAEEVVQAVWEAERVSRLLVHVGAGWRRRDDRIGLADLTGLSCAAPPRTRERSDVSVVIPFRGGDPDGARIRNLVAVLGALNDQTYPRDRYRLVVVETDAEPRWREVIEPRCDRYLFARNRENFNKSWAVNVGVVNGARPTEAVCILDADILVDSGFLERAAERFRTLGAQAHWPFQDMLFLDEKSSAEAVRARCLEKTPAVDQRSLRGVHLRRPPGGCIWLREGLFSRIGGMDERFAGWGGEDQDFEWRVDRYGALDRFADPLVHLNHPRASYRAPDGSPFFQQISFCSWPCDSAIGDPRRHEEGE